MTGRGRSWRRVLVVWAAVVVVGGGLTLWLQGSAESTGPYGGPEASPSPSLPEGWRSACAGATPDEQGRTLCFIRTR